MTLRAVTFLTRWSIAAWVVSGLWLVPWCMDRVPPFQTLGSSYHPPVVPGGPMRLALEVRRDMTRSCSVSGQRWVQDKSGARFYLESIDLSPDDVRDLEASTPGLALLLFDLPRNAARGPASYHADLQYICNPVHHVWPIRVESRARFVIE